MTENMVIALQGKKLVVPPQLQFVVDRLLQTPGRVNTSDNDINAIKNMGMVSEGYTVNNFLTDNDAWFLMTDCPDGFKHFERSPLSTSMEGDFDTGNVRFKLEKDTHLDSQIQEQCLHLKVHNLN